jgi:pimeloyl-ACP methyl ester carboxylesterase
MTPGMLATDRADLAFETFGGPADSPLVLIAGLGAQMVIWRSEFCRALAARGHFVVRFDNRDFGRSTKFPAGGYGLADMADDVAGLIGALGLGSAHVVGQSLGGMIAEELVLRHPDRVRSLCLLSTTPNLAFFLPEGVAALVGDGMAARSRAEAVEQFLARETFFAGPKYHVEVDWTREVAGLMWDRDPDPGVGGRQMAVILGAADRLHSLTSVSCPTVIVHGDADRLISPSAAKALAEAIPDAELHIMPGMGHQLPSALWPEITRLISANARRASRDSWSRPELRAQDVRP